MKTILEDSTAYGTQKSCCPQGIYRPLTGARVSTGLSRGVIPLLLLFTFAFTGVNVCPRGGESLTTHTFIRDGGSYRSFWLLLYCF